MRAEDVQILSNADAIAAFFGRLRYNTNARTVQTPGNLGISNESTLRRIRRIELIADNEGFLQVYLFQLVSLTVADARALASTFRNRAGNFLLVLTANFDRIDFVLVEKHTPVDQEGGIAKPQVKLRPIPFSVDRHKPERIQLRVLGRFTWTEVDAFAQYEKLVAAYSLAYWSEEYFNNRALFSDYFLTERLANSDDFPEWNEEPKPAYGQMRQIYQAAAKITPALKEPLRLELLEPIFGQLGFELGRGRKDDTPEEPDYRLYPLNHKAGDKPLAVCLAYPWGRFLDGKDETRDAETPGHNPGQRVVSLLERAEAPWIVMTNGRLWRLYSPKATSRASNYYEVDLADALGQSVTFAAEPGDAFRYFWLLFRRQSFEATASARDGKRVSLLDRLFTGSREFAARLGENLKDRVFEHIFQILAEGFVAHIRHKEGRDAVLPQERLDAIFQGVLTLLYRLLFLLYAEARDLLPVKETRDYFDASLTKLKSEIEVAAGPIRDQEGERLRERYRADSYALFDRLTGLFAVIDRGDSNLNVPRYNGGLFLSKIDKDDASAEVAGARFLNENKLPDPHLAHALDLLARDEDPRQHKLVPIDFKSLGVRQLGSIYEGLLEFKLRVADEKKAVVKEKRRDVYVSFKELGERERERAESQGRIVKKGQLYLENDKGERKATGSYYTPDHIVEYIVENAVGPIVAEKFEAMRPKLREAEQWHRERVKSAKAKGENPKKYESGPAVENQWYKLVNDLFNITVLDPAMGSGHFLVETVNYVTDKALAFLNSFPWNPVTAHLESVRSTILDEMEEQGILIDPRRLTDVNLLKRHVLKRCIYGVDLNPMAVELAKVSLWLHCFTLGAPLSFLDHHMRCGNSLIGVSVQEVQDELRQGSLFGSWFAGLMLATELMRHVGELSDVTTEQVDESKNEYRKASEALAPFKRILDVYTSQWFGNASKKAPRVKGTTVDPPVIAFLKTRQADAFIKARTAAALQKALSAIPPAEQRIARNSSGIGRAETLLSLGA